MAGLITLDTPLVIKIQEGGEVKEELKITFRYPTKEEEKEFKTFTDKMQKVLKELRNLENKANTINKKLFYAEKTENYEKAEKLIDKKEKLTNESEKLLKIFEENGGDSFQENLSKKMFELLVNGKDKQKLDDIAQRIGYTKIIESLSKEREEVEKKQFTK